MVPPYPLDTSTTGEKAKPSFEIMPRATKKTSFPHIALICSLVLLWACTSPEERFERDFNTAVSERESGNPERALEILDRLAAEQPENPQVLAEQGRAYISQGEAETGAFFLEQASLMLPEDIGLLEETFDVHRSIEDEAGLRDIIMRMEAVAPEMLGAEEWLTIARVKADRNETRPALEAYLRANRMSGGAVEGGDAFEVGQLFYTVENYAQAERWLKTAEEHPDFQLQAQFGLLELYLARQQWADAEAQMQTIDEGFPGAVEGSEWAEARVELQRWRERREAAISQVTAIQQPTETVVSETEDSETVEAPVPDDEEPTTVGETAPSEASEPAETEAVVAGSVKMDLPETEAEGDLAASAETRALTFDPNIQLQPADPDFGISVTFDGATPGTVVFRSDSLEGAAPTAVPEATDFSTDDAATDPSDTESDPTPSASVLLDRANQQALAGNQQAAIRLFWQALGQRPEDAEIWHLLARSYLIEGERRNAETTSLEAIRLAPENVTYALQHLRIVQQVRPPADFIREIERAQRQFPESPEITLTLARAYDRILDNRSAARTQYNRFLRLAPGHPMSEEAETALNRLR